MGGSTLGAQAIYDFLNHKIKKNLYLLIILNAKKNEEKKIYKFNCIKIGKYN